MGCGKQQMAKTLKAFNPSNPVEIQKIIADCENWDGYEGKNVDGEHVQLFVTEDSLEIWTIRKKKPRWFECVEYDEYGYQIGVWYQPIEQSKCRAANVAQYHFYDIMPDVWGFFVEFNHKKN